MVGGMILKIHIQDYSGNRTLYKNKCDINNRQELLMIFSNLLSFGIDIRKIAADLDKLEKRELEKIEEDLAWFK